MVNGLESWRIVLKTKHGVEPDWGNEVSFEFEAVLEPVWELRPGSFIEQSPGTLPIELSVAVGVDADFLGLPEHPWRQLGLRVIISVEYGIGLDREIRHE